MAIIILFLALFASSAFAVKMHGGEDNTAECEKLKYFIDLYKQDIKEVKVYVAEVKEYIEGYEAVKRSEEEQIPEVAETRDKVERQIIKLADEEVKVVNKVDRLIALYDFYINFSDDTYKTKEVKRSLARIEAPMKTTIDKKGAVERQSMLETMKGSIVSRFNEMKSMTAQNKMGGSRKDLDELLEEIFKLIAKLDELDQKRLEKIQELGIVTGQLTNLYSDVGFWTYYLSQETAYVLAPYEGSLTYLKTTLKELKRMYKREGCKPKL